MLKLIESMTLERKISSYRDEAEYILQIAESYAQVPTGSLAKHFQNLSANHERVALRQAFAIIVEMADRTLNLRPYCVQVMGALAMCDGHVAEMATGEGKTLAAALPLAWHGLHARSHCMTANEYLASRDADVLRPLYEALGLTVEHINSRMGREVKQLAYQSSIVYSTPSQFVFDYLRDNICQSVSEQLHTDKHFILVDEADSIFIDEARTPIVLSGEGHTDQHLWAQVYGFINGLDTAEKQIDERSSLEKMSFHLPEVDAHIAFNVAENNATLTEKGFQAVEAFFVEQGLITDPKELWQIGKSYLWRITNACVKARALFLRDKHYIVKAGKVVIIDQETGRLASGRRWADGIHQAIEAKEGVEIKPESKDVGRIALSNYLALYHKVSGMTGTAMSEAHEIQDLYGLSVIPIPTHKPRIRIDHPDVVFMSRSGKLKQILEDVKVIHAKGQPILIGTSSVEESEKLSDLMTAHGLKHYVLNAKQDEDEALVIAQAGRLGAITIATNMAGRGTDIVLGGNTEMLERISEDRLQELGINPFDPNEKEKVVQVGGLFVIGTERLDSPRLDLQLAGRSGRQGDPGESRFYIALDDPLLKNFGGETLRNLFIRMGISENDGLEHPMITRAIQKAQQKKQGLYIGSRKQGHRQDCVIDKPRRIFLRHRDDILWADGEMLRNQIADCVPEAVERLISVYLNDAQGYEEQWDLEGLQEKMEAWQLSMAWFNKLYENFKQQGLKKVLLSEELTTWIRFELKARLHDLDEHLIRSALLVSIDSQWQIFLDESEHIRSGIHLRAYAQVDPEKALQQEIFKLFSALYLDLPVVMLDLTFSTLRVYEETQAAMAEEPQAESL